MVLSVARWRVPPAARGLDFVIVVSSAPDPSYTGSGMPGTTENCIDTIDQSPDFR
jgi:hypothetical protein